MTILPSLVPIGSFEGMSSSTSPICRCFPGDSCWPSLYDWRSFNSSIDGILIASVPIAAVCHEFHSSDTPVLTYNSNACEEAKDNWFSPEFHLQSSSSAIGAPIFMNNSCNPFLKKDEPYTLGNLVEYTVDAQKLSHIQTAIRFVSQYNIRLVIRSIGHDYC
jgi:hypothetical protein